MRLVGLFRNSSYNDRNDKKEKINLVLISIITYSIHSLKSDRHPIAVNCIQLTFTESVPLTPCGVEVVFSFEHFTDRRTPWTSDQLVAGPLPKHRTHTHTINRYIYQTSMPFVEFEPTIPAYERAKTVHALDRSAKVTCLNLNMFENKILFK
jgi:hypothetical protein